MVSTSYEYEIKYGLVRITSVTSLEREIKVPSKIDGKNVYQICKNSFVNLPCEKIYLPKTIGKIEDDSFVNLENLKYLELYSLEDFYTPLSIDSIDISKLHLYSYSVTVADKFERIYGKNFYKLESAKDFKFKVINEKYKVGEITNFRVRGDNLIFPDEIDGYRIIKINGKVRTPIKKVVFPKSLVQIPDEFLKNQKDIELKIPENVNSIGSCAFMNTTFKDGIIIPKNVEFLGECCFSYNYSFYERLEDTEEERISLNVIFEKGLEVTLKSCSLKNRNVTFKGSREVLLEGDNIFEGADVKNLSIGKNFEIRRGMFKYALLINFKGFENINIIEDEGFYGTHFKSKKDRNLDLTNITFLGCGAFSNSNIEKVFIPITVELSEMLFESSQLSKVTFEKGFFLDNIPLRCFSNLKNLKKITLPRSIKTIGESAFSCTNLEKINLEYVKHIKELAFNLTKLESVNLRNLEKMGSKAFMNCQNLTKVYMGNNKLEKIPDEAFFVDRNLSDIKLSKNTKIIGREAFKDCKSLSSFNFDNVTEIKALAFEESGLFEINLPKIKKMEKEVFLGCNKLRKVVFSDDLTYLSTGLLKYCVNLENFTIPKNVTNMGYKCLAGVDLKELVLPESVNYVGGLAFASSKIEKLYFKNGNIRFDRDALSYNYHLKTLYIDKMKRIPTGFLSMVPNLTTVVFGESVEEIKNSAITDTPHLKIVVIKNKYCTVGKGNFCKANIDTMFFDNDYEINKLKKRKSFKINNVKKISSFRESKRR